VSLRLPPRLRRILLAYTVNKLGTWLGYVALALGVYDHTHSALAVSGLLAASSLLPAILSPALVARIEAAGRRGELTRLYVVEALTSAFLAVLLWHFWLPAVLLLGAVDGTAALAANALLRTAAAVVGGESQQMITPVADGASSLAATDHAEMGARKANAALNIGFTTTFAIGPAIAGVVVATAGGPTALIIDAATFLICGILLVDLRPHVDEAHASVRRRLAVAWQHVRSAPELRAILLTEAVAIIFFAAAPPVEVLYAKVTLHVGDSGYGLLLAVWGVGTVLGSFIFARSVHRSLGPMLSGGTLAVGVAYLGWAAFPDLAAACVAAVIGGLGNGVQWAALISMVQKLTPSSLHGRLMSAVESIGAFCPALGFLLGGGIAALTSPRGAFLLAGGVSTMLTVVFLRIARAELRSSQANTSIREPGAALDEDDLRDAGALTARAAELK
jgi:MFS family permease